MDYEKVSPDAAQRIMGAGFQIKTARVDAGITLNKLGRLVDSTHSRICYLEGADEANPTIDTLNKIAKALGMCVSIEFVRPDEMIRRAELFLSRRRVRVREKLANASTRQILGETK